MQEVPITWRHDPRTRVHVLRDGLAMVRQTPQIIRSARTAEVEAPALSAPDVREADGVFDARNASRMQRVDCTHWWFRSKAAYVATALRITSSGHDELGVLIDSGGGSGGVTRMLGWPTDQVVVIEGSPVLIATATHHLGLAGLQGSVSQLPVADQTADVVTLLDVIEHLPDPAAALAEAHRVLRPGRRLVLNVPAHPWLWSQADIELGHHRRYTRSRLRQELAGSDFAPELVTHVFSWLVPPVW